MLKKWIIGSALCCACIMMLSGIGYAQNPGSAKYEGSTTVKAHVVADSPEEPSTPQPDGSDDAVQPSGQTDSDTPDGTDVVKTDDINAGKWWLLLLGSCAVILYCGIRVYKTNENNQ